MVELMEQASLDLAKALAIAALLRPDGMTEQTEHIEAAMEALEDAIRNGKIAIDEATSLALAIRNNSRVSKPIHQSEEH